MKYGPRQEMAGSIFWTLPHSFIRAAIADFSMAWTEYLVNGHARDTLFQFSNLQTITRKHQQRVNDVTMRARLEPYPT